MKTLAILILGFSILSIIVPIHAQSGCPIPIPGDILNPPNLAYTIPENTSFDSTSNPETWLHFPQWQYDLWGGWRFGQPSHGTLKLLLIADDGSNGFVYTPNKGYVGEDKFGYIGTFDTADCGIQYGNSAMITIKVYEPHPNPVPEFPSLIIPVVVIIGFLGAVLFIQRTREH
jgi:hypothetical protein